MQRFPSKQKAIDLAIWQNLNHRYPSNFGVTISYAEGDYLVVEKDHPSFEKKEFEDFPEDYKEMDYGHIRQIAMDKNPLRHWEDIRGMLAVLHGENLRFLLNAKVPLDKFIRYELARRGYDNNFKWIGFDRAEAYWLE